MFLGNLREGTSVLAWSLGDKWPLKPGILEEHTFITAQSGGPRSNVALGGRSHGWQG